MHLKNYNINILNTYEYLKKTLNCKSMLYTAFHPSAYTNLISEVINNPRNSTIKNIFLSHWDRFNEVCMFYIFLVGIQ